MQVGAALHPGEAPAAPFVGREAEVQGLIDALTQVTGPGHGRVVLIAGEPGIGKTTLVREALRRVGSARDAAPAVTVAGDAAATKREVPATVLWGRCVDGEGAPPFWPWTQALRSYVLAQSREDLEDELGGDAALVAQILPDLRQRFADLDASGVNDADPSRFRLFDRFTAFLRVAAAAQPLVLVLDDLHWSDATSLQLLEFLAREIAESAIAVVATYRDTDVGPEHPLAMTLGTLLREPVVTRIRLGGLNVAECGRIAQGLCGAELPEPAGRAIHDRTNGNPLFVGEVVRWLATADRLTTADRVEAWSTGFPEGLHGMIAQRLARIPAPARRVLQVAALIGDEIDLDLVEAVLAAAPRDAGSTEEVVDALDQATGFRILMPDESLPTRLRFSHGLVADALRAEVTGLRRARLHAAIGRAIETVFATNLGVHAEALVAHFSRAGARYADRVLRYAREGGQTAMLRGGFAEAAQLYQAALRALESVDPANEAEHADLLQCMALAQMRAGRVQESLAAFDQVIRYARRSARPELLADAAVDRAGVIPEVGKSDPVACAILEEALTGLPERDLARRSRVGARLAQEIWPVDFPRAEALARQAFSLARQSSEPTALAYAYHAISGGGPEIERVGAVDEMLAVGERLGDLDLISRARARRIRIHTTTGDAPALEAELRALERLAAESRQPRHLWLAQVFRASWLLGRGHLAEGETLALEATRLGERAQEPNAGQVLSAQLFLLRGFQGRHGELAPFLEVLVAENPQAVWWSVGLAHCFVEAGELERARAVIEGLPELNSWVHVRHQAWLVMMGLLARVLAALGDRDRGAVVHPLLKEHSGENADDVLTMGSVDLPIARLAEVLGRPDEAEEHYERAYAMGRRMGALPSLGETLLAFGVFLRSMDRDAERAAMLLEAARDIGRRVGMPSLAARADRVLGDAAPPSQVLAPEQTATAPRATAPSPGPIPDAGSFTQGRNVFRREGEFWTLAFDGSVVRVRDARAMRHLERLLRAPGREIHVSELAEVESAERSEAGTPGAATASRADGPIPVARERQIYRERLESLQEELALAERHNDRARAAALTAQIESLVDEIGVRLRLQPSATAGGTPGPSLESLRSTVTKGLRRQVAKIQQEHPALGRHLAACLTIGLLCSYAPEKALAWEMD